MFIFDIVAAINFNSCNRSVTICVYLENAGQSKKKRKSTVKKKYVINNFSFTKLWAYKIR